MPLPPGEEEEKSTEENSEPKLQFSYVECLIFAFHQLAKKVDHELCIWHCSLSMYTVCRAWPRQWSTCQSPLDCQFWLVKLPYLLAKLTTRILVNCKTQIHAIWEGAKKKTNYPEIFRRKMQKSASIMWNMHWIMQKFQQLTKLIIKPFEKHLKILPTM